MKVLLKLDVIYQMHKYSIYTCISKKKKSSLWIEIVFKQKKIASLKLDILWFLL